MICKYCLNKVKIQSYKLFYFGFRITFYCKTCHTTFNLYNKYLIEDYLNYKILYKKR